MLINQKIKCPVCGEYFEFEYDLKIGDVTYCVNCDEELKVVRVTPPKVKQVKVEEEEFKKRYSGKESFDKEFDEENEEHNDAGDYDMENAGIEEDAYRDDL
ncbi:MAG: hypothetical protein ABII75_02855 [Candidatus Omnitrophota bacterium]